MIDTILWDVDGTLLDFLAAERYGITKCFREIGIEIDDAMLADYSRINLSWWEKHERGEISQKEIFNGRLIEFFDKYGIPHTDFDLFNEHYQLALGEEIAFKDDSLNLLKRLKGSCNQYIVTNGSALAQKAKLANSGIESIVDGIFISEEVGHQKPTKEYFEVIQEKTGFDPSKTLIVGDSLTGDIRGGNNAGIHTCWYNPSGKKQIKGINVEYEIQNLWQIIDLLGSC